MRSNSLRRSCRPLPRLLRLLLLAIPCAAALAASTAVLAEEAVEFNRDIRPILSNNCFQCHGPDANERQAGLRLDEEQAAREHGALSPGDVDESELLRRVTAEDPDLRMPPADTGKQLTEAQVELLRRWVAQGAAYQRHWSLEPPRPQEPPAVDSPRAANDVDRFLLHRLQQQGLTYSEPADRRTLIRRVYQDVIGLPPTPDEVDAFLADTSPDAYAKVVDRLLDSPRYGERMAVYWLDLVRYADTNGIHGDNHREHWLYRDYVIRAFNDNLPFDQFTREQLAGDLLPEPTRWQLIASGYNRLNMTTREGGAQAKEYRAKYAADRVRNASTVWMGATLGCAECHDHKFDPYSTKDFYQFAAFFADVQETAVGAQSATAVPTAEQKRELARMDQELAGLRRRLDQPDEQTATKLERSQAKWEQHWREQENWRPQTITAAQGVGGTKLELQDEGRVARAAEPADKDTFALQFEADLTAITGLKLTTLADDQLPAKGPGLAGNGNFVISEVRLFVDGEAQPTGEATADHSQQGFDAARAADGKPDTGWAVLPQTGKSHELVIPLAQPVSGAAWKVEVACNYGSKHLPGRLQLSVTQSASPAVGESGVPPEIVKLLEIDRPQRNQAQRRQLADWHRTIASELAPLRKQIAALEGQRDALAAAAPKVLIAMSGEPRTTRVLPRGNWLDDSGEVVQPRTPGFLPAIEASPEQRLTRLDLAEWLTDDRNPFVVRVMVNRLWMLAFGHGIVDTLDDFGAQGSWPSHPALLDYLAVDFRDHGWDVKRTLRKILMSSAYRQTSATTPELRKRDPFNRLYARQSRFRLDAELVRDNALAVSGLLVNKLGGPSAKPYQPSGYWSHLNFPRRTYQHDVGEDQYRRGVYTYWCRTFLHPSLRAFDASTREECTVQRPRSNTPLAALVLLNDPTYVESARTLAERAVADAQAPGERLEFMYRQVLTRDPSAREADTLLSLAEQHRKHYASDAEAAAGVAGVGLKPVDEDLDVAELAAWTSVARVILNLHETITRN